MMSLAEKRTAARPRVMCASAHLSSRPAVKVRFAAGESAMTSYFYASDETCPEHQHHPLMVAAFITPPVMILVSVVGSLFGMA
jgi:hypothetical protein